MIYDVVTYNGEEELFDIRFNVLKDKVDKFIVVEFDETFSGRPKAPTFSSELHGKYGEKVRYFWHTRDIYDKYLDLAKNSPNTIGAEHWKREFAQKESIKDVLGACQDDDMVFIGDVDEIWEWDDAFLSTNKIAKLKLRVYAYWLNNRSNEEFWGTIFTRYRWIKDKCLNHVRSDQRLRTEDYWGWHFTSMGGFERVRNKLSDSYTRESYWTEEVEGALADNMANNKDFLGRNFTYWLDESEWPLYLKNNRNKYLHLIKD